MEQPYATTESLSDFVAIVQATPAYDTAPVPTSRNADSPSAPPSGKAQFLAAETTGIDSVRASYKALGIETSSTSTAASRVYTIYQQDGTLFKFGVTDADFGRMNQSLEMAGPGSYARYTDIMPKYQAHLGEKYLRSLQYNSTGVWPLPGMKVPYPIDFTTQLPVPHQ
jgi:hypothetical protein